MLGLALVLGLFAVVSTGRVSDPGVGREALVAVTPHAAARVLLVFIDSLSSELATDAEQMPVLSRLAKEGASFDVEPCRDQLTYLCHQGPARQRDWHQRLSPVSPLAVHRPPAH